MSKRRGAKPPEEIATGAGHERPVACRHALDGDGGARRGAFIAGTPGDEVRDGRDRRGLFPSRFLQEEKARVRRGVLEDLLIAEVDDFGKMTSFCDQLAQELAVLRVKELVGQDEPQPYCSASPSVL